MAELLGLLKRQLGLEDRVQRCENQLVVAFDLLGQNFSRPQHPRLSLLKPEDAG